jgi:membrane protein DedA with SNARE-associated domain
MCSRLSREQLRRKTPKLIVVAAVIVVIVFIFLEVLEDLFVGGAMLMGGPFVVAVVGFTRDVIGIMSSWGYIGVFVLMLLESSSLPIPSEMVLPFAGYLVSVGQLDFWMSVAVATMAGIGGSLVDYYIGLKGVHFLTQRRVLGRAFLSKSQLDTAAHWFYKYGAIMVFVSRMIPVFRTLISFPAGAIQMPLKKFIPYTAFGCLIWNIMLIYVGYFLGTRWSEVTGVLNYVVIAVVAVSVAMFVMYLFWRRRRIAAAASFCVVPQDS